MSQKLIILMGLPGSGKTTFADEYESKITNRYWSNYLRRIDVDQLKERYPKRNAEALIADEYKVSSSQCLIDGLFLTTNDIIKIVETIHRYYGEEHISDLEIHFWTPNREVCLYNDQGRRSKPSRETILNAHIEKPNLKTIREKTNIKNIKLVTHEVIRKPAWKELVESNGVCLSQSKFFTSERWSLGGAHGNCWDSNMYYSDPEPQPEFVKLDDLLSKLCPNITFLQYKKIMRECVTIEEETYGEYYGGYCKYAWYRCDVERMVEILEEFGFTFKEGNNDGN